MPTKVAFLGPQGTYAEQAALELSKLENLDDVELVPCNGLRAVIEHASDKICDAAVVPIENSVEGGVTSSLDALWRNPNLVISRALILPIRHCLFSNGTLAQISEVLSHPQALAQCSEWLNNNLPNALQLPTSSTAEAIRMIKDSNFRAAIGSRESNKNIRLNEVAFPINDVPGNRTRFVLLTNETSKETGNRASFAFSLKANSPGALMKALSCIADIGLNMSRIESRPSKRELGEYVFFIDVEVEKTNVQTINKLIERLKPLCEHFVHLGLYETNEINVENN